MDTAMFKKMRVKPPCTARVLFAPSGYPQPEEYQWTDADGADFVHVFMESREQFFERFPLAEAACNDGAQLWVSYPKSKGKKTYDINRDSLWGLLLPAGFHPVSQVALDEEWSALRVKRNQPGVDYQAPSNVCAKRQQGGSR